ncbi:uncharacterized protein LOC126803657 [Argentina anserina]|uniref:uncharacterized protein LOC126803657 n=1 Tax=Argentina anserina TaxID=57926 RepID=UPI0021764C93|nr:uncharacterized protein LOC126803657 [Potentilla anserina]
MVLVIYNLPPNVCMSSENLMLSLLIPGPRQPGNDIDVYLQPLRDDLVKLWNGVEMYDAYSKAMFNLRAILLWTINDFPAYGNLSGLAAILPRNHQFRKKHKWFNGNVEKRMRPKIFTGRAIVAALAGFKNTWGKKKGKVKKLKRGDTAKILKKKSVLYDLPYGEELPLCYNTDVMHCEKNVSKAILRAIFDEKGNSKIRGLSCRDLELMELMDDDVPKEERKDKIDSSQPYTFTKVELQKFCWRLYMQRFPDGYCSNIANCVKMKDCKLQGLKSHDHHVLMQVLNKRRLEELEDEIIETLCLFERYFPPSFFDVMIHLTIHIGREAKLCGPVHYRWMYPFERYMKVLKDYVKNRACPEGSIAENYLADECIRFCGRYSKHPIFSSKRKRNDVDENEFINEGSTILKGQSVQLTDEMHKAVHLCVPNNSEQIRSEGKSISVGLDDTLFYLAKGPRRCAMSYSGFIINGKRFHTMEANVSTQDYGVHIEADNLCNYYGIIRDILVLDFHKLRLAVFQCDWANMGPGVKKVDGFTLVNLHEGLTKKDPFILASHAQQVFYSKESEQSSWYVVLKAPPRGFYDLELFDESVFTSFVAQESSALHVDNDDGVEP